MSGAMKIWPFDSQLATDLMHGLRQADQVSSNILSILLRQHERFSMQWTDSSHLITVAGRPCEGKKEIPKGILDRNLELSLSADRSRALELAQFSCPRPSTECQASQKRQFEEVEQKVLLAKPAWIC